MGAVSSCCGVEPADNKEIIGADSAAVAATGGNGSGPDYRSAAKGSVKDGTSGKHGGTRGDDHRSVTGGTGKSGLSESEIESFQRKLESAMNVIVLLADGTRLTCQLKLNPEERSLVISCDTNLRVIPLIELKSVLHGRDQLKRVETKANLVDDANCVALHMMTGNCIPMRFDLLEDKQAFVELVKRLKK